MPQAPRPNKAHVEDVVKMNETGRDRSESNVKTGVHALRGH